MDEGSHQSTPDVDTTKEDRAAMLAEFEEYAESKRCMRCLELAQFAEWREWDRVMEQDRDWNKLIQSRDDTILSSQLGALEDMLPTPSILTNCIKPKWMQPVKYAKAVNNAPFSCTREVPSSTPATQVQVETRLNSVADLQDSSGSQK